MVEHSLTLDSIFGSLADATRRDILKRVSKEELSIGDLAVRYKLSFAAIAKHIQILTMAKLVTKRRAGKQQIVSVVPKTVEVALNHLEQYEKLWEARFDSLDDLLKS